MRKFVLSQVVLALSLVATSQLANAHSDHHGHMRADGHAPAGVMFEHMHGKGGLMVGYNAQRVEQDGSYYQGTNKVDVTGLGYAGYADKQDMYMHMLHVMYAPTDHITLNIMPTYMSSSMDIRDTTGQKTSSDQHGWGDTLVGASYRVFKNDQHHVMATAAISAPTGEYKAKRTDGTLEPYNMQLGAGIWQALPSITYQYTEDKVNAGAQIFARLPLENTNDLGYYKGDQVGGTAWVSYLWHPAVSTSMRVQHTKTDNIRGAYTGSTLNIPEYGTANYGGRQTLAGFGVNTVVFNKVRVGAEYMIPVYEKYNGLQQGVDNIWNLSISTALK